MNEHCNWFMVISVLSRDSIIIIMMVHIVTSQLTINFTFGTYIFHNYLACLCVKSHKRAFWLNLLCPFPCLSSSGVEVYVHYLSCCDEICFIADTVSMFSYCSRQQLFFATTLCSSIIVLSLRP